MNKLDRILQHTRVSSAAGNAPITCNCVRTRDCTASSETVCCLYHQKKDFISVPYEPNADYLKR